MRAILCCVVLAACAQQAEFVPTENVTATGHGGQPAASYQIRDQTDGDANVVVNVWSRGARERDGRTLIDMVVAVRNTGNEPVALRPDQLVLETYSNEGRSLPDAVLAAGLDAGALRVPAGTAHDIQLRFVMPAHVRPDDIGSLRLRWALQHDDGAAYVQFTELARVREEYVYAPGYATFYDPVFGYYDPFFYPGPVGYHVPVRRVVVRDHRVVGRR